MIIYIAPEDEKMFKRTLDYAKQRDIRMIVVSKELIYEEVNKGKGLHYSKDVYMVGDAETIWIVGHGNEVEIGDKTSEGVTLTHENLVTFLKSIMTDKGEKYRGSIVIDTCKSGVKGETKKTFADLVYNRMNDEFPQCTVGGWIGSARGSISAGYTILTEEVFNGDEGFAWANRKTPAIQDQNVLANLA